MASTVGGSLFAAVAFSGAGYLFHLLDKGGYSSEMKRQSGYGKLVKSKRGLVRGGNKEER